MDVSNVTNFFEMFDQNNDALSDDNMCAIQVSFSTNDNWPYDWYSSCPDNSNIVLGCTMRQQIISIHKQILMMSLVL